MRVRDATSGEIAGWAPGKSPGEIVAAIASEDGAAGAVLAREPFDSEVFHRSIARIVSLTAASGDALRPLLDALTRRATEAGVAQVLRRVRLGDYPEIWSLESSGFEI